ncbi:Hypothetical protein PHPALM_13900 [Phytophthora palmivora]|uniref:Uncharacterized protein n=1 Tax=Phytophthora palmivora TaxID=4796 RepID=A0A2P4XW48_9STRA|nr:Hypothetical protein PHPALM_13900 [Phytophthora palmivora]
MTLLNTMCQLDQNACTSTIAPCEPRRSSAVSCRRIAATKIPGLSCSGGTHDRCDNPRRAHNWKVRLPVRVQEWIDRTYGSRNDTRRH